MRSDDVIQFPYNLEYVVTYLELGARRGASENSSASLTYDFSLILAARRIQTRLSLNDCYSASQDE